MCVNGEDHPMPDKIDHAHGCYLSEAGTSNAYMVHDRHLKYDMCGDGCLHGLIYTVDVDNRDVPMFYSLQGVCWDPARKTTFKAKKFIADCDLTRNLTDRAEKDIYIEAQNTPCFTSEASMHFIRYPHQIRICSLGKRGFVDYCDLMKVPNQNASLVQTLSRWPFQQ